MSNVNFTFVVSSRKHGSVDVVAPAKFKEEIERRRWYIHYSRNRTPERRLSVTSRSSLTLHRFIWDLAGRGPTPQIDHVDGNPLNNSEDNLRAATQAENRRNIRRRTNNTSGAIGVAWCKRTGRWETYVTVDRKRHFFGRFHDKEEAIRVRDAAVARLHGEFAVFNKYHPVESGPKPIQSTERDAP